MNQGLAFQQLKQLAPCLSAGIVSANLLELSKDIALVEKSEAKALHFDVMDGYFAPLLTVGVPFVKSVKSKLLKDVHLMVQNPEKHLDDFVEAGADIITVQWESSDNIPGVLHSLGKASNKNDPERGIVRGVAINPNTPVDVIVSLIGHFELLMILAVDPTTRPMQSFAFDGLCKKFQQAKQLLQKHSHPALLCLDGGIKKDNISAMAELGADLVVSGSALFKGDLLSNTKEMHAALSL